MRVRVYGTWPDGTEDSVVVSGDDENELLNECLHAAEIRRWYDCWSEELAD